MEHIVYGSTDPVDIVIDDAELYENISSVSFEMDKKYIIDKNEVSVDSDSCGIRFAQLFIITLIAAATRIIVFFTLEI